jgi:hypothetical protein
MQITAMGGERSASGWMTTTHVEVTGSEDTYPGLPQKST